MHASVLGARQLGFILSIQSRLPVGSRRRADLNTEPLYRKTSLSPKSVRERGGTVLYTFELGDV